MRAALARPVLRLSSSRRESDRRWLGADRLADPIRQPASLRADMETESIAAVLDGAAWLTRQFAAYAADRFASPKSSTQIVAMTPSHIVSGFVRAVSNR
jgi:hypothetical protein